MHIAIIYSLTAIFTVLSAATPLTATTRLIYQYPNNSHTWLENIIARPNGCLVLTSVEHPGGLLMLNPLASSPVPAQIYSFPNFNSTTGITKSLVSGETDVYYFIAGNFSLAHLSAQPGSNNIFRLSFSSNGAAQVQHVAQAPQAGLLNGMTAFNATTLLAADSTKGLIWAIDTTTGLSRIAVNNSYFAPPSSLPFTVNGLHFPGAAHSVLYFTDTAKATFGRIPLGLDASAIGAPQTLTSSSNYNGDYDDFTFTSNGQTAYAMVGSGNEVEKIVLNADGTVTSTSLFAGNLNSTQIAEPTSATFGSTSQDSNVLYVTTGGGLAIPVQQGGKPVTVGAQLIAITVS